MNYHYYAYIIDKTKFIKLKKEERMRSENRGIGIGIIILD